MDDTGQRENLITLLSRENERRRNLSSAPKRAAVKKLRLNCSESTDLFLQIGTIHRLIIIIVLSLSLLLFMRLQYSLAVHLR
jgi:hypothetical protein